MHKKRERALLKSKKNQSLSKDKNTNILKTLYSTVGQEYANKSKFMVGLMKYKKHKERTKVITSQYALNYKQPTKQLTPSKPRRFKDQILKNTELFLNSALTGREQVKSTSCFKHSEEFNKKKDLSNQSEELMFKKQSSATNDESESYYLQTNKQKHSHRPDSSSNSYFQSIKKLKKIKIEEQQLFNSALQDIRQKECYLEEEKQKFKMVKSLYQNQIKRLTQKLKKIEANQYLHHYSSEKCMKKEKSKRLVKKLNRFPRKNMLKC